MPAPTRYVTCTAIVAGALMAGYAVGSQAKGTPNAALAGAIALGAVGGATAFVVNSMAPDVAAAQVHNLLVNHPDPRSLRGEEIEGILKKFGINKTNEKFNTELRNLYDSFVSSVIPPGNEDLKGDEAATIRKFKEALGLDDPDAAAVHIEICRRIVRQRLETGDRDTAVEELRAFQKLVYVSNLVFGEASKFLLPWKRVFKVTDSQVCFGCCLYTALTHVVYKDVNIDQLKELRRIQLKVQLSDEITSSLFKSHTQKLLEGYISRALEVLKARTRIKDTKKLVMELENMLAYNDLLSALAKDADSSSLVPGLGPASVIGGVYDSDRAMDDLKLLYRTYLSEAVVSNGQLLKEKLPLLAQLKNTFGIGNREADDIMLDITTKVYRRRLSLAVTDGDLDAATSKATFLQNLCNSLQFDPAKASKVHEEIYRQKLEQCVADGSLSDEDISALLRLRVLLCIPQETVETAHADICGRIFAKVVNTAISSGVDGYDPETTATVRAAIKGLRLSQKAAMDIASKAVRTMFMTYVKRSRTADNRTESARELKKMILFNNLVVTELVDDIKQDPNVVKAEFVEEKKVEEVDYIDDGLEMLQSLRKTKPDQTRETSGKEPQKEITLRDDLPARDRTDLYRLYLIYCLTGETTHMPFGSSIVVQRDSSEFERLGELGIILGLTPMEIGTVHKGLAEQAFKQQAEVILADGKLLPQKMEQLVEVQKQLGLPSDSFQKVVHNIATTKMAGAIDAAVRSGELKVEEIKEMRDAGVKIDSMISKEQREKMYRSLVDRELSSGKGEFDEDKFYTSMPAELELDPAKCRSMVDDLAKQRLKSSLIQAVALLRQKNETGVVSQLTNLLLCDKLVRSEKLSWAVKDELKDLYCIYVKTSPPAEKQQRLQELFGFSASMAKSLEDFVAANGFSLAGDEEELNGARAMEEDTKKEEEFNIGPLSVLTSSVKQNTQEQQEAAGARQGIRSPLQHGAGERPRDVDGGAQDGQGEEEGQAREQGPVHQQDVPPRRLGHHRAQESQVKPAPDRHPSRESRSSKNTKTEVQASASDVRDPEQPIPARLGGRRKISISINQKDKSVPPKAHSSTLARIKTAQGVKT
ncbi:hypothetical protein SELMODRAFT_443745 [Selaginella moellendorffii]|uniref:Uncharacterized protein n=1 Tax=Selaginella moellendorffii TaxID=88036 RepID=D8S416_SELML|nr:hypothetical protein SELMODRAFT_443745 [Selaginella moellendorffii]